MGPTRHIDNAPAVELRGIDKRFGAVHANRNVWLEVRRGSIHGIVGENGAGKSTLMRILYGYYRPDAGEIRVGGLPTAIRSTHNAIRAGIDMVHQHFMLVDAFTVLENVMLGAEGGALLASGARRARDALAQLESHYGLEVPPEAIVGELPVGLQQRVEILKALYRGAEVLILDEPTGVLTPQETEKLFAILSSLRTKGVTVILITHKLREIMAVTDTVSVMRAGEMVAHRPTSQTSEEHLAELMVGRKVLLRVSKDAARIGEPVLSVQRLSVTDSRGIARVRDVSFDVHAGEIVGVAGVSGNGQTELLEALAGMLPAAAGRFSVRGAVIDRAHPRDPRAMRRLGVAHVPEDRLRTGLVREFTAAEAAILGYHDDRRYGGRLLLRRRAIEEACARALEAFDVRPRDPTLPVENFSGGNQQKLVLAREMQREPALLLVGQPTRGVDIGAIEFIHRQLLAMRAAGRAILLVSVELEEIMSLADRIVVMFDGGIVGEVDAAQATERHLGMMMADVHAPAAAVPGATP